MILSVCPHDKIKTAETKITKLGTGIVNHDTSPTNEQRYSKVKVRVRAWVGVGLVALCHIKIIFSSVMTKQQSENQETEITEYFQHRHQLYEKQKQTIHFNLRLEKQNF